MVTLANNHLTVKINELGAEVSSVIDQNTGYEFMWQADEEFWGRHAPVLFPIVGRLKDDQYKYQGTPYEMTQHGFARDSMFKVEEITKKQAVFSLVYNEETLKKYPFKFQLFIIYTLEENALTVAYEVRNVSTTTEMYYGIGGHPAFNVAQKENEKGELEFSEVSVRFEPADEQLFIPLSSEGLLKLSEAEKQTVDQYELTHESFKNDAFVYKIQPETAIILSDNRNDVEIRVTLNEMDHVGIWSPYPKRAPFVCLEPWAGVADDEGTSGQYDEKYGINHLAPEATRTHDYTIQFSKI